MKKANFIYALALSVPMVFLAGCSDDDDASSSAGASSTSSNPSLGDSTPTGKITADGFFVLYDPAIPDVFDSDLSYTQQEVDITVFAEDVNDLVELNGHTVNFKAEWGAFLNERDSCVLSNGSCTVTWRSGDPATAPGSCFVAITAWAEGEEAFFDGNDDGEFDTTEAFLDMEEPFLDINSNGSFDAAIATPELVGEMIDIVNFDGTTPGATNGSHDSGNLLYDGSLCATNNAANCSGRESMIIHTRSVLQIQAPFTDSNDIDGDLDTSEEIIFCGGNPY